MNYRCRKILIDFWPIIIILYKTFIGKSCSGLNIPHTNATAVPMKFYEDIVNIKCDTGFTLENNDLSYISVCNASGMWDPIEICHGKNKEKRLFYSHFPKLCICFKYVLMYIMFYLCLLHKLSILVDLNGQSYHLHLPHMTLALPTVMLSPTLLRRMITCSIQLNI